MQKTKLVLLFIAFSAYLSAQVNVDSVFNVAINQAHTKAYTEAIVTAEKALSHDSLRYDVAVFMANVYAWQQQYNTSKEILEDVYTHVPELSELYDAWLNVLLWNSEYKNLLSTIDTAQVNNYTNRYNIVLKTALAHKGLENYAAGVRYLNQNSDLLDSADINALYLEMKYKANKNVISALYSIDLFENNSPTPQHLAYIDYSTTIRNTIVITRLNYTNRFHLEDFMPEIDMYHTFKNGHYLYANYGLGITQNLFPRNRAGLEYFFPFGNSYEASGGGRILDFSTKNIYILTGSIGKYFSNKWINLRPFFTIQEAGNAVSFLGKMRSYDYNQIAYWGIDVLYGNSPDDRFYYSQLIKNQWLSSYGLKLDRNFAIFKTDEIRCGVAYYYEEYAQTSYRSRIMFEILLKHRF